MSYYVDPCNNVLQYPLYPVYGYHPSIVARQLRRQQRQHQPQPSIPCFNNAGVDSSRQNRLPGLHHDADLSRSISDRKRERSGYKPRRLHVEKSSRRGRERNMNDI
uniref:Uncharacterized protein n=1 Tax=Oryza sativa subsp. japonica TaxID=39947 RepID=Q69UF6_ORYSJ|nr:hypothetical protein [Oryza sativa Japonica Group]BAD33113.1 hypothetical protein [Oryza sativa Japonica Group]